MPLLSTGLCNLGEFIITGSPILPFFNIYDIREKCVEYSTCYPENGIAYLMNAKEFRDLLGVKGGQWEMCNSAVNFMFMLDRQQMYGYELKKLLNTGLPVLIYNGD
jgi:carboxypeptidase C (cathepsin A)